MQAWCAHPKPRLNDLSHHVAPSVAIAAALGRVKSLDHLKKVTPKLIEKDQATAQWRWEWDESEKTPYAEVRKEFKQGERAYARVAVSLGGRTQSFLPDGAAGTGCSPLRSVVAGVRQAGAALLLSTFWSAS